MVADDPKMVVLTSTTSQSTKNLTFNKIVKDDIVLDSKGVSTVASLKDIMFLPFKTWILYSFIAVTTFSILLHIYLLGYHPIIEGNLSMLITSIEVFYGVHTLLLLLHLVMKDHRRTHIYKPVPIILIIFDLITIIPIAKLHTLMDRFKWNPEYGVDQLEYHESYLKLLRVVRVILFYKNIRGDPGLNQKMILILFHLLYAIIITLATSTMYYRLSCFECGIPNWTNELQYLDFDPDDDWHWFLICLFYPLTIFHHNARKNIPYYDRTEMGVTAIAMMCGYILLYMYFNGCLISEYIQIMRFKYQFENKLISMKQLMTSIDFAPNLESKVVNFYQTIWNQSRGMISMPKIINLFPKSVVDEIFMDIYWEAICHTHMFAKYHKAFKRDLCAIMYTEIFLAGELICEANKMKHKMYYLATGILEIMSNENKNSPILSLSTGTIIGEVACLLPTLATANVRCATICKFHTLEFHNINLLRRKYPKISLDINQRLARRIARAKYQKNLLESMNTDVSHMLWIKSQWRKFYKWNNSTKTKKNPPTANPLFFSRYLDLLVLSTFDELKVHSICIRGKCPFVLEEHSSFRFFMSRLSLSSVLLQTFCTSYLIAFEGKINPSLYPFLTVLDAIYFWDIYIQCITAGTVHNVLITKPSEVLVYRSKQFTFLVDLAATIPYDYFGFMFQTSDYIIGLLRIPRFLKLYKIIQFFRHKETFLISHVVMIKFIKFMTLHVCMLNLLILLTYMSTCFMMECSETGWLVKNREINRLKGIYYSASDYVETMFLAVSTYFSLSMNLKHPGNLTDLVVILAITLIGYYMIINMYVQMCAAAALSFEHLNYQKQYWETLENFIRENRLIKRYKGKIYEYVGMQWHFSKNLNLSAIRHITNTKSKVLCYLVEQDYLLDIIKKTDLFQYCDPQFLKLVVKDCNLYCIPPKFRLYRRNRRSYYIYIIVKGYVNLYSYLPGDEERSFFKCCTKYTMLAVLETLQEIRSFSEAETVTAVQVLTISYLHLRSLLHAIPSEAKIFYDTLKENHEKFMYLYQSMNRVTTYQLPLTRAITKGAVKMFEYNTNFAQETDLNAMKDRAYENSTVVEKWRRLFHCLFWTTYNPQSKLYLFYEVFSCTFIVIQIIGCYFAMYDDYFPCTSIYCILFIMSWITFWIVDMYIKAHIQYYNDNGIKVTNLRSTCKNYMSHSFIVDLLGGFPYRTFSVSLLFCSKDDVALEMILLLTMRFALIYRPIQLWIYVHGNFYIKHEFLARKAFSSLCLMLLCGYLTSMRFFLTCGLTRSQGIVCPADSWIKMAPAAETWGEDNYIIVCLYTVVTSTLVLEYEIYSTRDYLGFALIGIVYVVVRMIYITNCTGYSLFGNKKLAQYQDIIKHYLNFINDKIISNRDKKEMLDHFGNNWKKTKGVNTKKILRNCYPFLKETIFMELYSKALKNCTLFQGVETCFYNLIATHLEEVHYILRADIIRSNDVQTKLFIVLKGLVDIYVADSQLITLCEGGIFGCFKRHGCTRQTIHARAKVHIVLLEIESKKFYEIISLFPLLAKRMEYYEKLQLEYVANKADELNISLRSTLYSDKVQTSFSNLFLYPIKETNIYYMIFNYVTNVHIAPITSIMCLFLMVVYERDLHIILWLLIDIYFLIYIYFRVHVTYTNLDSGIVITRISALIRRYIRSFRFYIDVITLLPIYLLKVTIFQNALSNYFLLNKLLRITFLFEYYWGFVQKKNVPRHLRWMFLIYIIFFLFQAVYNCWWLVHNHPEVGFEEQIIGSYLHVLNMFTGSGLSHNTLFNLNEIWANIFIAIVLQGTFINLSEIFARMVMMQHFNEANYKNETELFKIYCQKEDVSMPLINKAWKYLMYLYKRQNGEQLPEMINLSPPYIRQDHLHALYNNHFRNHILFSMSHVDFIRQLQMHIKLHNYMPGFTIVEEGEINETLYFIEEGEVLAIKSDKNTFVILLHGDSFGERESLLNEPFTQTFRTLTPCLIISLCKKDWFYLVDWFPATKQSLYDIVNQYF